MTRSIGAASCWPWPRSAWRTTAPPSYAVYWPLVIPPATCMSVDGKGMPTRDLHPLGHPELAGRWMDGLIEDCRDARAVEVRGVARTLKRWRDQILVWHSTGASNGPTEGLNSIIKKLTQVGAGFRSFANYWLRILLAVGGCNWSLLNPAPR